MKEDNIICCLIHERIKEKVKPLNYICRKELFTILGRVYHIPRHKRHAVLRELIALEKLRFIKKDYLEIL